MNIEFPKRKGPYKYIWASVGGEDYVRFDNLDYQHKWMMRDLADELGAEDVNREAVRDAGAGDVNLDKKLISIWAGSLGRSTEYDDRSDPEGFKELIEANTDFEVRL